MGNCSQQKNMTVSLKLISSSECVAWLTVYGFEAVAIVMLNALTAIIYLKERSLRKPSIYLVINLAIADTLIGGLLILHVWFLGSDCNFWTSDLNELSDLVIIALFRFFPLASATNLAAISLERTHATFRPFAHRVVKKKIFGAAVVAVWIIAGLTSAISVFNVYLDCVLESSHFFYISYLSIYSLCLFLILVSYTSIAIRIMRRNQPHHHGARNRERELTKTLFIATVTSILLTLPYVICWFLALTHPIPTNSTWFQLSEFFNFLFSANSLVNPVLYTFRVPEFKRAFFSVVRCGRQPEPPQVFPLNDRPVRST
ncbi:lysophosphatidic acid receptor 1-like [Acropora millepora]|uniref:lysophosphatidic acid receptor 1-like n=1 Tax=Acropora millepora TaxID=45264 RepID=UPI001CF48B40|nr:lysophosphatidic acid receptor 1-like [Acropora millepora]